MRIPASDKVRFMPHKVHLKRTGHGNSYSYTVVRSADREKLLLTTATIGTWLRANHPDAGPSSIDFLVLKETSAKFLRPLLREYYSELFSIFLTSSEAVIEGPGGPAGDG